MPILDGKGASRFAAGVVAAQTLVQRGWQVVTESEVLLSTIPDYSTFFPSPPTAYAAYKVFRGVTGRYRTDVSWGSLLPVGYGSYGRVFVSMLGADGNSGATPYSGSSGPKLTLGTQYNLATDQCIYLPPCGYDVVAALRNRDWETVRLAIKSGVAFTQARGLGGLDAGANKIVQSWTPGQSAVITNFLNTTDDITWTLNTTLGMWTNNTAGISTISPAAVVDFDVLNTFGLPNINQVVTPSTLTITNATNSGGAILITTSAAHGLTTGARVVIFSVGGVTAANGAWIVTVVNTTTFTLNGSTFAGSYTSGGTVALMDAVVAQRCARVNDVLYYNNGSTTVAPRGAYTFVSANSARHIHNNPAFRTLWRDVVFIGGSIIFSSICGHLISSSVDGGSGTYTITTGAAHGWANGNTVTHTGIQGVPSLNGDFVIGGVTSNTYTITLASAGNGTANSGVAVRKTPEMVQGFFNCGFALGCGSGSNGVQFEGWGTTFLQNCVLAGAPTDGIDYRALRHFWEDNVMVYGCGAGLTNNINQGTTGHSGARGITVECEISDTQGPAIQDVNERGVLSYRVVFGGYFYRSTGTTVQTAVGISVAGGGTIVTVADASRIWVYDANYRDPNGGNINTASRYAVQDSGTIYINNPVLSTQRTLIGSGSETFVASPA
jgi:hypothetical protein